MVKSFIRLLLLVVTPLLLLLFVRGSYNPVTIVSNYIDEKYVLRAFDGALRLVEAELVAVDAAMQRQRFKQIAADFGTQLELLEMPKLNLSWIDQQRLSTEDTRVLFHDPPKLARRVKGTDFLVVMSVIELEEQAAYRHAQGPLNLLGQYVQRHPQSQWPDAVAHLRSSVVPILELVENTQIQHSGAITNSFSKEEISWFEYDDKSDVYYYQLGDSQQSLMLGPIPSEIRILQSRFILQGLMVFIALASVVFFWLWPLWLNIKKLKIGAINFGKGKLESRVAIDRGSMIAELGDSFNYMADRIQTLVTTNQRLADSLAHDLRTPLARIRFALAILESNNCTEEEKLQYQQSIEYSINALDHLINQTLTHSRYNSLTDIRNFSECLFSNIVKEEVEQRKIDHPQLEFEVSISRKLESRRQFVVKSALRRALANLIDNAIKHASTKIKVSYRRIDYETSGKRKTHLAIIVEDDGEGIPAKQRQRILEPYVQLNHGTEKGFSGQGLGLAIVNQVARWHKGQLIVDESELGGALIKLSWPPLSNPDPADQELSVQILGDD